MKRNFTIQLKAAFLLTVFALNTIVGFACAMGVDMGFNTTHRNDDEKKGSIHVHANGKKHQHHHSEANRISGNVKSAAATHQHQDDATGKNHSKSNDSKKDDCCNDKVVKISQEDKAVCNSNTLVNPVFFTAFISIYYQIDITQPSQVTASNKYFVLGHHPPITDIRIAIQSFQI